MIKIWVLTWKYYDGSGYGVTRCYFDQGEAETDKKIFEEMSGTEKEWTLSQVEGRGNQKEPDSIKDTLDMILVTLQSIESNTDSIEDNTTDKGRGVIHSAT